MKTCPPCNQDCSQSDTCPKRIQAVKADTTQTADSAPAWCTPDDFWQYIETLLSYAYLALVAVFVIASISGFAGYFYARIVEFLA